MALARIITRSHQYSQQLALDLLARGYAVEIVSPDATPSGPADLELRVEAGGTESSDQVTQIRGQDKIGKSIEYLQRLKPMMTDLLRKWPASDGDAPGISDGFNFNAEADTGDMELPSADRQPSAKPTHLEEPVFTENAHLISPPRPQKSAPPSVSVFSITGEPMAWEESETGRGGRSEVWFWRAAVGFASMALLILVLGMALRRNPSPHSQASPALGPQAVAAKTQPAPAVNAPSATKNLAPVPAKAAVIPTAVPAATNAQKSKPSAVIRRAKVARSDDVEDGDTTITYFKSKSAEPARESSAKQVSGIKRYSDLD
jgi:hypothetical protein